MFAVEGVGTMSAGMEAEERRLWVCECCDSICVEAFVVLFESVWRLYCRSRYA
jgi:hypothetical protein